MAARDFIQHQDASDERVRVAALAKHEQAIRESERRRIAAALVSTDGRPSTDWPGCVE
jgi:hypothetical protein